jgi:hypothetical protein
LRQSAGRGDSSKSFRPKTDSSRSNKMAAESAAAWVILLAGQVQHAAYKKASQQMRAKCNTDYQQLPVLRCTYGISGAAAAA